MHNVLITGMLHPVALKRLGACPDLAVEYHPDLPMAEILPRLAKVHCLISRSETTVDRAVIDAAPELKVIARAAVGVGNIDIDYATERGILVMNAPARNTNSAAELTMALLLAAIRKVVPAHGAMAKGGWDRHRFTGNELGGRTLGIVGLGNVGHRVARFALGFDMNVISYDPYIPDETFARHRVRKVDLATLVREADVVSVHTPKNRETTGMIGAAEIAAMKDGVILLNAARGGIVDEPAMLAALQSGKVAAAGIDTWAVEPPADNPFRDFANVVMTPHIGASTDEAQLRIAEFIADQVPKALAGGVVEAPLNMPQIRMIEGNIMSSYVVLAEKLGSFAAQYLDFRPDRLACAYRGDIAGQDCRLLRLSFLKGFLQSQMPYVSYVNAEQRALSFGLTTRDIEDGSFSDYENAVKFTLTGGDLEFSIGGVVFGGPHPRITLVDGYRYEAEPRGTFLLVRCDNKLGVLADISHVLDRHQCLIERIDFSHSKARKRTMFMFRVVRNLTDEVLADLTALPHARMVRKIII
jgi:D-3-phosphoglycerate dehydrogenase